MKYLLSILCLFVLSCDGDDSSSGSESEVEGCIDVDACNFNADATIDDNNCLEFDCFDICGGSTEIDECGICGGTGPGTCGCNNIPLGDCDCNGNVLDCAGECGGVAVDDCAGECGGSSIEDACGICDDDTDNDCSEASCPYSDDDLFYAKGIDYNYNQTAIDDEVSIQLNSGLLSSFEGMTCVLDDNNNLTFTGDWESYNDECYDVYDCGDSGCKIFMFGIDESETAHAIMDAAYATYFPQSDAYDTSCSDDYIHLYEICVPSCDSQECGSDGCLGSCGSCSGGYSCQSGSCVEDVDECAECLAGCSGLPGCCWGGINCMCSSVCP